MDGPTDARPGAPYCYRHPDRETYISCQRCGRPICPDCMRQASVGFHCPECVADDARSARPSRTVAGGIAPRQVGLVSFILIGINVVAFLAQLATGGYAAGALTFWGAMLNDSGPATETDGTRVYLTGVADGDWWRVIISGFLHLGWLHLLLNMYALYLFGPMLERMLGHLRFVAMYATSLIGGSLFVYLFADPNALTVGASGAIFGLLGCTLVVFFKLGYDTRFLLALLAINGVLTVVLGGISWQGHLGGFFAGALTGLAFAFAPRNGRVYTQAAALGILWCMIVAGFVVQTPHLNG